LKMGMANFRRRVPTREAAATATHNIRDFTHFLNI
jgi:hypothetical protein